MAMLTKDGLAVGPPGLEDVVERLVRYYQPSKAILFGSYAWGTPHQYSDVDLFVVKEDPRRALDRILDLRLMLERTGGVPFPLDLLVYTPEEVRQRLAIDDWFVQNILDKGITVQTNAVDVATALDAARQVRRVIVPLL
jgi:uncharacterized protein